MTTFTNPVWIVLPALFLLPACKKKPDTGSALTSSSPSSPKKRHDMSKAEAEHAAPIDCPLRKQGINPHDLRPFADVEKYIAFLERKDRATWQKPDEVVAALGLSGRETVVDLGAGSGYFTFRLSRALPHGKVVAIDVQPEMIRHIHHKAVSKGIKNIEVLLATTDDPKVPREADLVFVCDVLHHVKSRRRWMAKLASAMKRGATLVLVEFKEGKLPEGPPESVKISKAEIVDLVRRAGFKLTGEKQALLPYQSFLLFRKI